MKSTSPQSRRGPSAMLSLQDQRHLLQSREVSPRSLASLVSKDIEALDSGPLPLRGFISVHDSSSVSDQPFDPERDSGGLWGITVGVKDNCDTTNLPTSAGSLALLDAPPSKRDAHIVARLKEAGATIIGKTNLSEWSNFRSTHSVSGWSGAGGQCRNPHVLDRSPGGSSSGSGAAVAAGLIPAAIGTETDGSIMCPAALNGIVGIKPTLGATSRSGVIPIAPSQDSVGVLARSVSTAREVLSYIVGPDPQDPATLQLRLDPLRLRHRSPRDPKTIRFGLASHSLMGYSAPTDHAVTEALEVLKRAGVTIIEGCDELGGGLLVDKDTEFAVLLHEFRLSLGSYLEHRNAPGTTSISEIAAEHRRRYNEELRIFGQELFDMAINDEPLSDEHYLELRNHQRDHAQRRIDTILADHHLDAIIAPTMSPAWKIDYVGGDVVQGSGYQVAAVAGYPSISLPVGSVKALPIGMVLMATSGGDVDLCDVAETVEEILDFSIAPQYRSSLEAEDVY